MNNSPTVSHSEIQQALADILQNRTLYPHFQPIVDLRNRKIIGHEALIRGPADSPLAMPCELFSTAITYERLHQLELTSRQCSLESFARLKPGGKLFLNISASLLSSPEHTEGFTVELLEQLGIPQVDIVIELSEQHPFDNQGLTHHAVEHYRQLGFQIAVDDLGTGYSGLKLWSELNPEYVKIDRHFVNYVDQDPVKREFVRAICKISEKTGCMVIAEGIERYEEVEALMQLGVSIGQGYYLGMPHPEPLSCFRSVALPEIENKALDEAENIDDSALALLNEVPGVSLQDSVLSVSELFLQYPDVSALPVIEQGAPVGVVRRDKLLELFSTQYGRALYEKKPVARIYSKHVLLVESKLPLAQVSRMVTDQDDLQQEIIIVQDGCYLGMANLRDLLKRITELKLQNARYANPLTLLPGNVPINQEMNRLLSRTEDFHVAYFDLNHFKPFNDCYGYSRGDQVIRLMGELLVRHAEEGENFVGHIGGDDFVVIFRSLDWQFTCERILREFEKEVRELYSPRDLQRNGISATDRNGELCFFPLLGLAIGVVHPDPYRCSSFHEVAELAAMAKKEAKKMEKSCLFVSRRRSIVTAARFPKENKRLGS